jgi:hypothetical protein
LTVPFQGTANARAMMQARLRAFAPAICDGGHNMFDWVGGDVIGRAGILLPLFRGVMDRM